jgi:hypothetical protein
MDRALPIFNRLVVERQAQQTFDIHRKHLEQIKVFEKHSRLLMIRTGCMTCLIN